jgi:long-chain fatty acid transport protein
MKKHALKKYVLSMSLAGLLTGFAGTANAAGFQLFQYDGASVGDVNAGAGATANTASTNFTNAAGLVRIKKPQIVVSANQVVTQSKFVGTATYLNNTSATGETVSRGSSLIPSFHFAAPINNQLFFGFSATVPFGSSTNYPIENFQSVFATESTIKTVNLSPSLAYKVSEKFSVALGIDVQKLEATLNQAINATYSIVNEASNWGYGWHAGTMYQFTPATRVGLSYRSQVSHNLSGTSTIKSRVSGADFSQSNALSAKIKLPPMTTLGVHHDVTPQWAVMGTVNYIQWSTIDTITLNNLAAFPQLPSSSPLPQKFRNTWRASVGTAYTINDKWLVRAGVGYDQTPTNNTDRSLRLPENNRWLVGIGARFRVTKQVAVDAGWTRAFIQDGPINNTTGAGNIRGNTKNSADILGLQITYDFA